MKFDVDDKDRCRLVCVKFHLNRCRFAVAVAKCLGAHFFGTQCSSVSCGLWTHSTELRDYNTKIGLINKLIIITEIFY